MSTTNDASPGAVGAPVEALVTQRADDFPAFPSPYLLPECCGLTMRDYFAAKAMQGLIAQSMGTALGSDPKHAAEYAYATADAMMAARAV